MTKDVANNRCFLNVFNQFVDVFGSGSWIVACGLPVGFGQVPELICQCPLKLRQPCLISRVDFVGAIVARRRECEDCFPQTSSRNPWVAMVRPSCSQSCGACLWVGNNGGNLSRSIIERVTSSSFIGRPSIRGTHLILAAHIRSPGNWLACFTQAAAEPRRADRPRGCRGSALPCAWTRREGQDAAMCRE